MRVFESMENDRRKQSTTLRGSWGRVVKNNSHDKGRALLEYGPLFDQLIALVSQQSHDYIHFVHRDWLF